ncbi:MAG: hypothetical protein AAF636_25000 [Pseudomonadota bacterium]
MSLSRRSFNTGLAALLGSGVVLPMTAAPAHAGFAIFAGVVSLVSTVVELRGTPFRANNPARQADPYMTALQENRNVFRVINRRLDGINLALTNIMSELSLLPQRIDQIVSSRLQEFRHENFAVELTAALDTLLEEVELGRPRNRLEDRLDQIREYRNRVIATEGYSILTLCSAMDMEFAAMKVLDYSRDQAEIVARTYEREFVDQLDTDNPNSLGGTVAYLIDHYRRNQESRDAGWDVLQGRIDGATDDGIRRQYGSRCRVIPVRAEFFRIVTTPYQGP